MFVKTFELILLLSVLYILVGSEDALTNPDEDRSIQNFNIMKHLPVFFEYLATYFLADEAHVLEEDYGEEAVMDKIDDAEEYTSFQYTKYDRVALTPEEVVEQILKVEHELEEYNDNGEL
ncbi:unnamed protein product [Pieris macdunnoughi]|uniref:Uncharacterized protein n=1 Tax=Pieris macdunnoughi TaxID=345717 RepID=A0A821UA08_9NEOP|nr:unnamed protein product [Pieris macdunnoughi]